MQGTSTLEDWRGVDVGQIRAHSRLRVKERVRVMVEAANVLLEVQEHARPKVVIASLDDIIDSKRAANRPEDQVALPIRSHSATRSHATPDLEVVHRPPPPGTD